MQMLVKDFRKPEEYFGNIEPGTVFTVEGGFYMAIEPVKEKDSNTLLNAINLETGELTYYFDTTAIQIVKAELCVR